MRNVHILCSTCPPPGTTAARGLFRHFPTALSMMRAANLAYPIRSQCVLVARGRP